MMDPDKMEKGATWLLIIGSILISIVLATIAWELIVAYWGCWFILLAWRAFRVADYERREKAMISDRETLEEIKARLKKEEP